MYFEVSVSRGICLVNPITGGIRDYPIPGWGVHFCTPHQKLTKGHKIWQKRVKRYLNMKKWQKKQKLAKKGKKWPKNGKNWHFSSIFQYFFKFE